MSRRWLGVLVGFALIVAAGVIAVLLIGDEPVPPTSPAEAEQLERNEIASCREAASGAPPKDWRRGAVHSGDFGLFGDARDFRNREVIGELPNGELSMKLPAIVVGESPVTVRVPDGYRGRVGLGFGNRRSPASTAAARTVVRFEPCVGRDRTGWPGGLVVADRRPIELEVEIEGETRMLRVGRG